MGEIIGSVNIVLAYLFYRIAGTPPSASVQLPKASKTSVTLSELAVEYQGEFTAKGFPRPFHSRLRRLKITLQTTLLLLNSALPAALLLPFNTLAT